MIALFIVLVQSIVVDSLYNCIFLKLLALEWQLLCNGKLATEYLDDISCIISFF